MPVFVACPACGFKIHTLEPSCDQSLRCVSCGHTFTPTHEEGGPVSSIPGSAAWDVEGADSVYRELPDEVPPQTRPSPLDELAGSRLPRCPTCGGVVSWSASHCPICGEELEEETAEEVLRRTKPSRRDCRPHRGNELAAWGMAGVALALLAVCTLGGSVAVALPVNVVVAIWASLDVENMKRGEVDPEGMELTRQARNMALVGILLSLCFGGLAVAYWLF